jgi:hypothetical protein
MIYRSTLDTFRDDVTSEELVDVYWLSIKATSELLNQDPIVYRYRDTMEFPRISAIWNIQGKYCSITAALNNDNDSIKWTVLEGVFNPNSLGMHVEVVDSLEYRLPFRD